MGWPGRCFFCTLALGRTRGQSRAAWAGLVLAGALGGFAVPTFVYVLAAAFSWLGLAWRHRGPQLAQLGAAAALTGAATAALYAPLLLVSGVAKFAGNGFVAALAPAVFWQGLPAYLWHTEGFLAGQRTLGALLVTGPVLALVGRLCWLARAGRLPAGQARRLRQLGGPALWFGAVPYALIAAQRVFPPERVLLYKAFFFFLLAGLVADWALGRWPAPAHRGPRRALAALALLFAAYEAYAVVRVNPAARRSNAAYRAGMAWLAGQPPGPVLAPEPTHNLFFRFYAHSELRQRAWQIDDDQRGRTRYAYVVAFPNQRGFFRPVFPFPPAYRNEELDIYAVPAGYPLVTRPWRH